jgi:phosphoglycerate dehydrogenase-like enzyme
MTLTSKRKLLIVTYHRIDLWIAPPWFAERLRSEFPQFEVSQLNSPECLGKDIAEAEIMFGDSLPPDQFGQAKKLRWIHSPAAAVHQFMFPALIKSAVVLTNAREVHGPGVAEHVMAMIFSIAKRIPESVRFQHQHVWGQEQLWRNGACPLDVDGATLGLVGFGSIGRNVARRAHSMGMKVIVVREHPEALHDEFVSEELPSSQLSAMLVKADYVVLSPPLTPRSRGMIGSDQLAQMKGTAYLINVGRGPLIDESALINALRARRIGGAALDVFDKEPLPPESLLWDLDNLLITPHTAGMAHNLWERHYAVFSENMRRYLNNQPLLAVVDKQSGY